MSFSEPLVVTTSDDSISGSEGNNSSPVKKSGTTLKDVLLHKNDKLVKIPEEREGAWIDFKVLRAYMGPAVRHTPRLSLTTSSPTLLLEISSLTSRNRTPTVADVPRISGPR